MKLSSTLNRVEPSKTLEIAALAQQLKEDGKDVIGLSAGEPDFDTPAFIAQAGIDAIRAGQTKYTDNAGMKALRQAIADQFARECGVKYDLDQIIVTSGAKQAVFNAAFGLFELGDEVLIPSPYWVSYTEIVHLTGATPVVVEGKEENDFKVNPGDLTRHLSPRTKGLILSTPCNPTGSVYGKDELNEIVRFCGEHGIWIISDEIYQKIVYDAKRAPSVADVSSQVNDRVVVVSGVSKTYAMTGWRIGYAAGPTLLIKAMGKLQSHTTSNASSVSQHAALAAICELEAGSKAMYEMVGEFRKRRDYLIDHLVSNAGLSAPAPAGAFYLFLKVSSFYKKSSGKHLVENSLGMCKFLIDEGVALVPGAAFGNDDYVRMSYAASYETIVEAVHRIVRGLEKLN